MAGLRASLLLVVLLLVAPVGAAAQQAGAPGGPTTFSTIALMVFAAGIGGMTVSLARGHARSRARVAPATVAALEPEPGAVALVALAPEPVAVVPVAVEPELVVVAPEPVVVEPEPVVVEPEPVVVEPEPVVVEPEPVVVEPEPVAVEPETVVVEPEPVVVQPEPVAVAAAEAPPEDLGPRSCHIRVWNGYVKQRFYAEAAGGEWVAQSPLFRLEKGRALEDSPRAAAALDALVDELAGAGWDVAPVH